MSTKRALYVNTALSYHVSKFTICAIIKPKCTKNIMKGYSFQRYLQAHPNICGLMLRRRTPTNMKKIVYLEMLIFWKHDSMCHSARFVFSAALIAEGYTKVDSHKYIFVLAECFKFVKYYLLHSLSCRTIDAVLL